MNNTNEMKSNWSHKMGQFSLVHECLTKTKQEQKYAVQIIVHNVLMIHLNIDNWIPKITEITKMKETKII